MLSDRCSIRASRGGTQWGNRALARSVPPGLARVEDFVLVNERDSRYVLNPGGRLMTSGMRRRRLSDYLLSLAEIRTHYRGPADLERLIAPRPFRDVRTRPDDLGIQTILTATK